MALIKDGVNPHTLAIHRRGRRGPGRDSPLVVAFGCFDNSFCACMFRWHPIPLRTSSTPLPVSRFSPSAPATKSSRSPAKGKIVSRKAGSTILEEGASGVAFFMILDGTVDISRDGRALARLMPGDFIGESALLTDRPRNATAIAATDVELFTFTPWSFKAILLGNAKIAYGVARSLAARVEGS